MGFYCTAILKGCNMKSFVLALCFVMGLMSASVFAQSAQDYATRMNNGRFFRHDRSWGGAEVIYQSSGTATRQDAMRWWMNSPPHRRLIQSGQITDIACVGNVCVGRSGGGGSYNQNVSYNQGVVNSSDGVPVVYTSMDGGVEPPGVVTTVDGVSGCDSCGGEQSFGGSRRGVFRRVFRR
jgi:hypothetical protein